MRLRGLTFGAALLIAALVGAGCAASPEPETPAPLAEGERLEVIATTSIVGDVVGAIGGDAIDLTVLMQPGQDPHSYEPVPADLARIEQADVVFANGLGLEGPLLDTLAEASDGTPIVAVSDGVEALDVEGGLHGGEEGDALDEGHAEDGADPHVWMDPWNVSIWVDNISATLIERDPTHADDYRAAAEAYRDALREIDEELRAQAAGIPPDRRVLVTNHEALHYFARRYGFDVVGTVYAGASSLAEPSAADLAALADVVADAGVPAIFVDSTISDELAHVVAQETGQKIGVYTLYTGALGPPGSGADSYLGMMRTDMETIAAALGD